MRVRHICFMVPVFFIVILCFSINHSSGKQAGDNNVDTGAARFPSFVKNRELAVSARPGRQRVRSFPRRSIYSVPKIVETPPNVVAFPHKTSIDQFDSENARKLADAIKGMRNSTRHYNLPSCKDWTEAGVLNADGTQLLTGSNAKDGRARLYDLEAKKVIGEMQMPKTGPVRDTAFHPTLPLLFSSDTTPILYAWNAETFEKVAEYVLLPENKIVRLAFAADGTGIAGTDQGRLLLWDAKTGKLIKEFAQEHKGGIRDIAFHPNGKTFATAGVDGSIRVWDTGKTASILAIPNAAKRDLFCIKYSPCGNVLAVTAKWDDPYTWIYDARSGEKLANYGGYGKSIRSVNFSPDGRYLITGDVDYLTVIWDIKTKEPVWADKRNMGNHVYRVMFTPKQDFVVVISGYGPSLFAMPETMKRP